MIYEKERIAGKLKAMTSSLIECRGENGKAVRIGQHERSELEKGELKLY